MSIQMSYFDVNQLISHGFKNPKNCELYIFVFFLDWYYCDIFKFMLHSSENISILAAWKL